MKLSTSKLQEITQTYFTPIVVKNIEDLRQEYPPVTISNEIGCIPPVVSISEEERRFLYLTCEHEWIQKQLFTSQYTCCNKCGKEPGI